jgi:hypothetical protein
MRYNSFDRYNYKFMRAKFTGIQIILSTIVFGIFLSYASSAFANGPVNPYSFSAIPGKQSGSVTLSWFDDPKPNQFNLLYGTNPNSNAYGVVNLPVLPVQPNTFTVNLLNPGQTYYFTLVGVTGNTTSQSGPVSAQATTMTNFTGTVTNPQASTGGNLFGFTVTNSPTPGTVDVTWTDNATAGRYDIVYGTTPGQYVYGVENVHFTPNATNTYPIGDLKVGTTYYFALVAERNGYVIVWTNPQSINVE